ncbi:hypothetical protein ACFLY7_00360 [Patescibacteria group bacterium]
MKKLRAVKRPRYKRSNKKKNTKRTSFSAIAPYKITREGQLVFLVINQTLTRSRMPYSRKYKTKFAGGNVEQRDNKAKNPAQACITREAYEEKEIGTSRETRLDYECSFKKELPEHGEGKHTKYFFLVNENSLPKDLIYREKIIIDGDSTLGKPMWINYLDLLNNKNFLHKEALLFFLKKLGYSVKKTKKRGWVKSTNPSN